MIASAASRPLRILIGALGGEGGGVLAEWLVEAATEAGFIAQSTSIPGVAQRTGATTYYVEVYPVPAGELGGRRPVLGLYPVPGAIDLLVASELLEAGRMLQAGMASPQRTLLLTSTSRTLTTAEKMALGDGRFPDERLLAVAREQSRKLVAFDMAAAARDAGTVVSAVMLGAIAGTQLLPVPRGLFEAVVRASGIGVEPSLRGFAAGFAAAAIEAASSDASLASAVSSPGRALWPAQVTDIVTAGEQRLVEFQDRRYAALYHERVEGVLAAERACDPSGASAFSLTREVARFLALWMAFDDIVRVADLKSRASRFARVRREVNASRADVVRIVDYFKPGVPEVAGLLPAGLARRLVAWDERRKARGAQPWSWPLHLGADTLHGMLLLRGLAAMRIVRRHGARYRDEQAGIERWLAAVLRAAGEDWHLAYEIALCGRLVKGYGETNERGKRNLAHILEHLASGPATPSDRAKAVRDAREAALADEGGKALDAALARHGAPARPVVAQPIRFIPKPATAARRRPTSDIAS